jgi:hypothetical protein
MPKPDPANPTGMWIKHAISEPGPWANHGSGVGDINGDGRVDFLNAFGWWEQPGERVQEVQRSGAESPASGTWKYHPVGIRQVDALEPGRSGDGRV